ncbi:hypothetical protein Agub_g14508 [Astrephomene gubernaculifera]|uniref:Anaphase-promoting complex subunit 4-like WD40 domain-containing protein n=1 Tax=Astrephomene gubernaculifera TaxID=47775 RepID=A0AAD3HT47_9CHLO|nr:hypothetical protein Agub_g14508 [Astrephomene gubernaculifera]
MTATEEGVALSQSSQVVLVIAGASAVVFLGYLVYALLGCIRAAGRALAPSHSSKAKLKPVKTKAAKDKTSDSDVDTPVASVSVAPGKERGPDLKSLIKAEKAAAKKKGATSKEDAMSHHELWLNTLKDHGDTVTGLAWSRDGRLLGSACEDMTLRLFDLGEDVGAKNPKFKRIRTARIPIGVGFGDSPDQLAAVLRGAPDTLVALYGPVVKQAGEAPVYDALWTVGNVHGKEPALPAVAASVPSEGAVGRRGYVVSLSTKREGRVYDMKGSLLASFEPSALANHDLAVSYDGRFIAAATFSSDVKIWEMKYSREGEFRGLLKAMNLSGHRGQVACVGLSYDNCRAATAGKDGMLKVWNIDVRYELSEDPKVLLAIPMPLPEGRIYQHLAFGPPGSDLLAASHEGVVHLLNLRSGELVERIAAHDGPITCMRWCPLPRKLLPGGAAAGAAGAAAAAGAVVFVLATASRDKRVRLWRAPKY